MAKSGATVGASTAQSLQKQTIVLAAAKGGVQGSAAKILGTVPAGAKFQSPTSQIIRVTGPGHLKTVAGESPKGNLFSFEYNPDYSILIYWVGGDNTIFQMLVNILQAAGGHLASPGVKMIVVSSAGPGGQQQAIIVTTASSLRKFLL